MHKGDVWESLGQFPTLTKIRPVQNHGLSPRLFGQNRSISDPWEFTWNLFQQAPKQLEFHFKAYRRLLREFETISNTYQNPSCSKPWVIAQAFWSKSVDFGPLGIYPKSPSNKLQNSYNSILKPIGDFWESLRQFPTLTKIRPLQNQVL